MEEIEKIKQKEEDIAEYMITQLKGKYNMDEDEMLKILLKINPDIIINDTNIEKLKKVDELSNFTKIASDSIGNICILSKFFCQLCNIIDSSLDNFDFNIEKSNCQNNLTSLQYFCVGIIKNYSELDTIIKSISEKVIMAMNLIGDYKSSKKD